MIYTIPLKKTADVAYFVSLFLSMLKNCIYYYIQRLNIKEWILSKHIQQLVSGQSKLVGQSAVSVK